MYDQAGLTSHFRPSDVPIMERHITIQVFVISMLERRIPSHIPLVGSPRQLDAGELSRNPIEGRLGRGPCSCQ
jgi:hypothetical protein